MSCELRVVSYLLLATCYLLLIPSYAQEQALSDINIEWLKKKEEALRWGRDPFMLPEKQPGDGGKEAASGEFRLSAIIYQAGRGVAIINNRIVRVGDVIEEMQVAEIRQDRVILRSASGNQELRVNRFLVSQ